MREPLKWYSDKGDHSPFIKALAEVRRIGAHEGWCYHHVQAIMMSIDQYAQAATGLDRLHTEAASKGLAAGF
jgi:hypothetical protein